MEDPINSEYNTFIIPKLKEYVIKLMNDLIPALEQNKYGLICSDDVSGRIPALIIGKLVNKILNKNGFSNLLTVGIKPKSLRHLKLPNPHKSIIDNIEYLTKYKKLINKPILVVTESLITGENYKIFEYYFQEIGVNFDLVTLTSLSPLEGYQVLPGNKIYTANVKLFNTTEEAVDRLQDNTSIVGFTRGDSGESFILKDEHGLHKMLKKVTRQDINKLSDEIFNEFFNEK